MGALLDLWKSERGLLALGIIVAATVLAALGNMTFAEWQNFVMVIFGTYVAGKSVTSAVETIKGARTAPAPAPAPAPEVKP